VQSCFSHNLIDGSRDTFWQPKRRNDPEVSARFGRVSSFALIHSFPFHQFNILSGASIRQSFWESFPLRLHCHPAVACATCQSPIFCDVAFLSSDLRFAPLDMWKTCRKSGDRATMSHARAFWCQTSPNLPHKTLAKRALRSEPVGKVSKNTCFYPGLPVTPNRKVQAQIPKLS